MSREGAEQPGLVRIGDGDLVGTARSALVEDLAEKDHGFARGLVFAEDDVGVAELADAAGLAGGVVEVAERVHGEDLAARVRRERRGAGRAELVDARLGVGETAAVPIARVVAHVGVAVGLGKARFHAEVALFRFVDLVRDGLLHAEDLDVARCVVL